MKALQEYLEWWWCLTLSTPKTTTMAFHLNNRDTHHQLNVSVKDAVPPNNDCPGYLGVALEYSLTYRHHIENLHHKVNTRNGLLRCLAGSIWDASTSTLRTGALTSVYSPAEYASLVWCHSAHSKHLDISLNDMMHTVTGCMRPTESLPPRPPPGRNHASRHPMQISYLVSCCCNQEQPNHLLHQRLSGSANANTCQCLKSWPGMQQASS